MRGIIMSSMKGRLVVVSVVALLLVLGISQLRDMQLGVFPEFSPVYVEVQTEALGLSADEIEQILTVALEQDLLNGIAYLDEIWSESMPGLSRVVCVFEPGTDPMIARQVVAERLTQAHALPNVSKPPVMLQPYSSTSRVMKVGLSPNSPDMSLINLSVLARWTIQPYLMGVEGVANVSIWGQRKRQLQVQVNPDTLKAKGVVLQDVIKTTGEALWVSPLSYLNSSTPGTGGFFDTPNQRLGIRHLFPISTPDELAQVSVTGKDLVLGDIATVVENHQPLIGDAIINGQPGLMLVIEKFPWASTRRVTENVEEALEALSPGLTGIAFDSEIYQPANFIEASFDNLTLVMAIGLILAIVLLFLFFSDWKAALISGLAIVLSLLTAAYVLHLRGTIFDMMIVAGFIVALGVIIDDAVTNVAQIRRKLSKRNENGMDKTVASVILQATLETRSPIFIVTLILLLAVLPLFFLEGVIGSFLSSLGFSYILALAASTLTALMVVPALSVLLYSKVSSPFRTSSNLSSLQNSIGSYVGKFLDRPALSYALLGVMAILGILSISLLNLTPEIPVPQERNLVITWEGEHGTSHPEMARVTTEAISKLRTIPGISNAAAHLGRAVMSDKINNVHSAEIWINIDEEADYDKTLTAVNQLIETYPNIKSEVTTYRAQTIHKTLTGTDHLYAVRVYGENQEVLKQKAEEVQRAISNVASVENPTVDYPAMEPTIEVEVDLEKAKQYNIKPGDVRRTAATLLAGIEVGSLFEGQKVFEVVVWGVPEVRNSISSIGNLLVDTPDGGHVPIGDVAEVRETANPAVIKREKVSRYMDISFNVSGNNTSGLDADINTALEQVNFPLEYHAELIGNFKNLQAMKSRVTGIAIAALIGMFLLLQATFWSWRLALVVLPSLFVACSGGLLVALMGGGFSLGALVGLLAVFGVAAQNGVLMIRHFKNLELHGSLKFGPQLVLRGVKDRLPPILATSLIMVVILLPIVLFGNAPGLEMVRPIALVTLGGLISSFLVNLFILPALYLAFGKVSESVMEEEKAMLELDVLTTSV